LRSTERSDLDSRVQLLLDKDEIRELTVMYVHRILARDWRGVANLFTEDCVVDYSDVGTFSRVARATQPNRDAGASMVLVGRKAVYDFFPVTGRLDVRAFFTNHIIRVNGEDAVGICLFENRITQDDESVIGAGRMFDEYQKIEGRWLISYRRQELFYMTGLKEGWAESPDRHKQPPPVVQRGWEEDLIKSWGTDT
jgi:hypothetical protein